MKKIALFCGALLIAGSMLFVACGKDEEKTATIQKFFSVDHATLVADDMPQATTSETISVDMNHNVITGGSSSVTVASERPARKILVGMKDQVGYYEIVPQNNRDYRYSFVMFIDQDIDLGEEINSFTVRVAIVDEEGEISQIWETPVELMVVGTGALQVSLSFDNAKDVDLHLIEPAQVDQDGYEYSFNDRHIYYGHKTNRNGGNLDLDSNASCSIDNVNNENITYNDTTAFIAPGTYKVYVDLWENCDASVATNYVVTVFYGGNMIATRSGIFDVDAPSTYNPINETYVEETEPFLTFTIGNNGQKRVKTFDPVPMTQSAIEKEAASVH